MAYGLKYELFFSDLIKRQLKVEILQNNYTGDVSPIVGTGSPVEIEWDADDDIYNPIIGSRCKLNFFVTDTAVYDEFYRADEREYKVKIKYYQPAGNNIEAEAVTWDGADMIWDANLGAPLYFQEFWEGFLVVDRYEESILSTPYPIALEAIDGLGTLDGFDAPLNTSDTSNTENLFYYLKEILLLTGHEFDIYIANSIRKTDGAANDSIFHDIEINEYGLFNKNLTIKTAKDVLEQILKITNSRIFQSYGRWYVVNNSSLIDNTVDVAQTLADANADSGADVNDDPATPVAGAVYTAPNITLSGQATMYIGTNYQLTVLNSGTNPVSYEFTLPDNSTVTQTGNVINTGTLFAENDGDTYSVVATDANGQTDSDSFTLDVDSRPIVIDPDPPEGETDDTNYTFVINVTNQVTNAYVSPLKGTIDYPAGEVGDAFTMQFNVVSLTGEFTSASQLTTSSVTGGYTVSKTLNGDFIEVTVTGNLPSGGGAETLTLIGAADVQQFTTSYTLSTNVTNASYAAAPASLSRTGGEGKPYTMTITYTAQSGYEFTGLGNVQIQASDDIGQTITSSFTSSQLVVTITGEQSISDQSATITITGAAQYANPATSITISPSGAQDVSESGGYFDVSITSDGGYIIYTPNEWIHLSRTSGTPNETFLRVNFDRNLRKNTRTGYIYFRPRGSETNLATLTLTQESAIQTQ
jgi:hypothetical protein